MKDSDWDIRREGRAWRGKEAGQRYDLTPEKLEMIEGRLLWDAEERVKLLGLLLENVGADRTVQLGNPQVWRAAVAALTETELRVDVAIESPTRRAEQRQIPKVVVHTGVMLSSLPAALLHSLGIAPLRPILLQRPNGDVIERRTGAVIVTIEGRSTIDDVVFAEPDDAIVVGWRTLSGLNLRLDTTQRQLVDAGPVPAAAVA